MNENKETFENKSDLSSNKHYLSSSEMRPEKSSGFEPITSAIPLQLYQLSQSQLGAGHYVGRK